MTAVEEPPGDYGYDLAHQDLAQQPGSPSSPPNPPVTQQHAPVTAEPAEDWSYDQSHDF